jgi:hypothetical protein
MKILVSLTALIVVVAAGWLLLGGPRPEAESPKGDSAESQTRTDGGEGGVVVSATYVTESALDDDPSLPGPTGSPRDQTIFFIAMNTHSVNLPDYPLEELAELSVNGKRLKPVGGWQPVSDDPHHVSGYLTFPKIDGDAGSMRLTIRDLAGVTERTLVWDLP